MKELERVGRRDSSEPAELDPTNKFDTAYQLVCHLKDQNQRKKRVKEEQKK